MFIVYDIGFYCKIIYYQLCVFCFLNEDVVFLFIGEYKKVVEIIEKKYCIFYKYEYVL